MSMPTTLMAARYFAMYRVYVFVFQVVYRVVATEMWHDSGGGGKTCDTSQSLFVCSMHLLFPVRLLVQLIVAYLREGGIEPLALG